MSTPYVAETSKSRFFIPKTLASDFDTFLDNDIPHTVMNFEKVTDWYARSASGYTPVYVRGELYPDTAKSRYENTDNFTNIRCSVSSGIKKGDIMIDADSNIYVLDWEIALQSNNAPSRALRCNLYLIMRRYRPETVDTSGYVVTEEGEDIVCASIPANAYRYDGRPEFNSISGTPGVVPNALTILSVQYNDQTKNIKTDDYFYWGGVKYIVIDADLVGVGLDNKGIVKLQARKAAGGSV